MIKETLTRSDYEVWESNPSKIDPSKTIKTLTGISCPHCGHILKDFGHSENAVCIDCGLLIQSFGNMLECTLK